MLAKISWQKTQLAQSPEYAAFYTARMAQEEERFSRELADIAAAEDLCKAVDDVCKKFAAGNMSIKSLVMEVWKTVGDEESKSTAEAWYDSRR